MIGGVVGDFIGSEFEHKTIKTYNLLQLTSVKSCITDESVMLSATADYLINEHRYNSFAEAYMKWGQHYLNKVDFGPGTSFWIEQGDVDYQHESFGNGAATRAGIIGMLDHLELWQLLKLAEESARCSHNSEEAINGAKAMTYVVLGVRCGRSKEEIYEYLHSEFDYLMFYDFEQLKREFTFDSSAEVTVPVAIFIALESNDWNDCIRKCLYVGGDVDSIATMSSLISSQRFSIDKKYLEETKRWLFQNNQPILQMCQEFEAKRALCKLPF